MCGISIFRCIFFALLSVNIASCTTDKPLDASASVSRVNRITVLYDAFGKDAQMKKDWGYAALVEVGGKRILFDTGDDPAIFAQNIEAKKVDVRQLDFVVLSHRHADHMGGLTYILKMNPAVKIYAPKEPFGIYGSDLPSKFYRKADNLPTAMRYFDGAPPETMKFGSAFPGANIHLIDKTTEVMPGVTLIALISETPGTKELKELSLAISTPEGLVLIVGCAHPGIENILAEAVKINPHIHLVAGGLHLLVAQDPVIEKVTAALMDTYKVDLIAPGHCTGEPTFVAMQKAFGERYIYAGVGSVIFMGAKTEKVALYQTPGRFDAADRMTYAALQAKGDD